MNIVSQPRIFGNYSSSSGSMFPNLKGFRDSLFLPYHLAAGKYNPNSPITKPFRFTMEVDSRVTDE